MGLGPGDKDLGFPEARDGLIENCIPAQDLLRPIVGYHSVSEIPVMAQRSKFAENWITGIKAEPDHA